MQTVRHLALDSTETHYNSMCRISELEIELQSNTKEINDLRIKAATCWEDGHEYKVQLLFSHGPLTDSSQCVHGPCKYIISGKYATSDALHVQITRLQRELDGMKDSCCHRPMVRCFLMACLAAAGPSPDSASAHIGARI